MNKPTEETNNKQKDSVSIQTLIIAIIITIVGTIGILDYQGRIVHTSKKSEQPLATYKVVYVAKEDAYKVSNKPSNQTAVCIDNYLFIKSDTDTNLQGILVDYKNRGVRCQ